MANFKCKMCGGDIPAAEGAAFGTCNSCGTTSTLPKANDEKLVNLFNRANHYRRLNEFDKALAAYESLLNEDGKNAEAHWGLVLCRYGIEYVEDPRTHERVPTCHRAQFESILSDADYLAALENAPDSYTRGLYEAEAKKISGIQKGILAISSKEEPYDVFICYKETTDGGSRTRDSLTAQEIYQQLTKENYKVFFSKITLEDKVGQQYEPYIFSALNSAKVMLVVGSQKEYFQSVWVKNEWSRYYALTKKDPSRLLIPCYKDIDPYDDLPGELSTLQGYDMSKVGFMHDLMHTVKKVLDRAGSAETKQAATTGTAAAPGVESLMKRGWLFLEDSDWKQADEYFDKVLDIDPEYAPAYVGKLCARLKVNREADLVQQVQSFSQVQSLEDDAGYKKALRFADAGYKARLEGYICTIKERILQEKKRKEEQERIKRERQAEQERLERERKAEQERLEREHLAKNVPRLTEIRKSFIKYQGCISIGDMLTVGLKPDGRVVADGRVIVDNIVSKYESFEILHGYKYAQCDVSDWQNMIAISTGKSYAVGLKADGLVVVVGFAECLVKKGVLVSRHSNVSNWRDIVAISAGYSHTVGLKADGTVVAVGNYDDREDSCCNVSGWRDIVAISAEGFKTVGLKADGTVVSTMDSNKVSGWRDIVAIAAGYDTVGLKADGTVVTTGDSNKVSGWRDIVAIAAGYDTVGLKADGTVVAVGNTHRNCKVPDWRKIVAISSCSWNTVGLKADGTVVAVVDNDYGQCNVSHWRDIGPVSEEKRLQMKKEKQRKQWQSQGLCPHCGGQMSGLIFKKCQSCGK